MSNLRSVSWNPNHPLRSLTNELFFIFVVVLLLFFFKPEAEFFKPKSAAEIKQFVEQPILPAVAGRAQSGSFGTLSGGIRHGDPTVAALHAL